MNQHPEQVRVKVRDELTNRFGGVTAFVRSPAVGLWKDANKVSRDDMLMFEVMSNQLDKEWWSNYRTQLQKEFCQEELLIWASDVTKL